MSTWIYDCEVLPNRTLFCARDDEVGEWFDLWLHEPGAPERLKKFLRQPGATFVGFNSLSFDRVVVAAMCAGRSSSDVKRIANDLIENGLAPWKALRKYSLPDMGFDHIDLIEVSPSFVGLKAYGARMHMPLLQDMPIAHDQEITAEQEATVLSYCHNDVLTTQELLHKLESELLLRVEMSRKYGTDMRSKSDAQMAEQAYITSMGLQRRENKIPTTVTYDPPEFISFTNHGLRTLLEQVRSHTFEMNQKTGHVILPDFLGAEQVTYKGGTYQLGVGGIHSTHDKSVCHVAGDDCITDIDAASFYPSIILECGFVPAGLGEAFVEEYRSIYRRRLEAKRVGDKTTDATLKISLNGSFGKLASRYSVLYAPDLMLAVTLTGQFTLLMLIERLAGAGVETLSANTDGIAVRYPARMRPEVERVVNEFSALSRFQFEYTEYRVLAMKDVNNYFAVKTDRTVKARGIYAPLSLKKNPTAGVCATAVGERLSKGSALLETIKNAHFEDFLSARNVTGGGEQSGEYLGKVVRWYQSTDRDLPPLRYAKNGNKVPKTEGARACMTLPQCGTHPDDLDYGWYLKESLRIMKNVGCAEYLTAEELELIAPPPKKQKKAKNAT